MAKAKPKLVRPSIPAPTAAAFVHVLWTCIGAIEQRVDWKEQGFDFVSGGQMLVDVLNAIEESLPAKRHSPEFEELLKAAREAARAKE